MHENHILFYVVPNSLIDRVEIGTLTFPDVDLTSKGFKRVFAGILVTKRVGPVDYVQAPPLELVFHEDGSVQSTVEIEKVETEKKAAEELMKKESEMAEAKKKEQEAEAKRIEDEQKKMETEMNKVIKFVIAHGSDVLDKMRAAAGAETSTPYLFEGNEGYENFMTKLEAEKIKGERNAVALSATGLGDGDDQSGSEDEEEEEEENTDSMDIDDDHSSSKSSSVVSSSKPKDHKRKAGKGKALPRKK